MYGRGVTLILLCLAVHALTMLTEGLAHRPVRRAFQKHNQKRSIHQDKVSQSHENTEIRMLQARRKRETFVYTFTNQVPGQMIPTNCTTCVTKSYSYTFKIPAGTTTKLTTPSTTTTTTTTTTATPSSVSPVVGISAPRTTTKIPTTTTTPVTAPVTTTTVAPSGPVEGAPCVDGALPCKNCNEEYSCQDGVVTAIVCEPNMFCYTTGCESGLSCP